MKQKSCHLAAMWHLEVVALGWGPGVDTDRRLTCTRVDFPMVVAGTVK